MKFRSIVFAALQMPALCYAAPFQGVLLSADKTELIITKSDGSNFKAPKYEDQTEFGSPRVSQDGMYAGWLAKYPNQGASYAQPLYLVVMDPEGSLHSFAGNFGMVFRWCFWPQAKAVVYAFSFPHGPSDTGFELRRIADERVLARYNIPDESSGGSAALRNAPTWVKCIPQWQQK